MNGRTFSPNPREPPLFNVKISKFPQGSAKLWKNKKVILNEKLPFGLLKKKTYSDIQIAIVFEYFEKINGQRKGKLSVHVCPGPFEQL